MDPIEQRMQSLEQVSTEMRIAIARVEEQIRAHAAASAVANAAVSTQLTALALQLESMAKQVEPLKEHRWRTHGVVAGLSMVVTIATTFLLRFWR